LGLLALVRFLFDGSDDAAAGDGDGLVGLLVGLLLGSALERFE